MTDHPFPLFSIPQEHKLFSNNIRREPRSDPYRLRDLREHPWVLGHALMVSWTLLVYLVLPPLLSRIPWASPNIWLWDSASLLICWWMKFLWSLWKGFLKNFAMLCSQNTLHLRQDVYWTFCSWLGACLQKMVSIGCRTPVLCQSYSVRFHCSRFSLCSWNAPNSGRFSCYFFSPSLQCKPDSIPACSQYYHESGLFPLIKEILGSPLKLPLLVSLSRYADHDYLLLCC